MGEFALYIMVILTSHAFVAFDVSATVFMLCIPYINPLKRDCHQLPKWGRLKVHGSPCVVLVINDNLYGLMFELRYFFRSCPWGKIEIHVLNSRSLYDDQGSIQGFI